MVCVVLVVIAILIGLLFWYGLADPCRRTPHHTTLPRGSIPTIIGIVLLLTLVSGIGGSVPHCPLAIARGGTLIPATRDHIPSPRIPA